MTLDTCHFDCEQTPIKHNNTDTRSPDYTIRALNLSKVYYNRKNCLSKTKTVVLNRVNINIEKNKMFNFF